MTLSLKNTITAVCIAVISLFLSTMVYATDNVEQRKKLEALVDFVDRKIDIEPINAASLNPSETKAQTTKFLPVIQEKCIDAHIEKQTRIINDFIGSVYGLSTAAKIRGAEQARRESLEIEKLMYQCAKDYGFKLSVKDILSDGRSTTWPEIFQRMITLFVEAGTP